MLPNTLLNAEESEVQSNPTKTYKLDLENKRILGLVDGEESLHQYTLKTILTERFMYDIYDTNYGAELESLIGEDIEYAKSEVIRIITEALMVDERVVNVYDFNFNQSAPDELEVNFKVDGQFASTDIGLVVRT